MTNLRILGFDLENKSLSYLGGDYTTARITAIAACWNKRPSTMRYWLFGLGKEVEVLEEFRAMYDQADIVTGHYFRKHDLPHINGVMLKYQLRPLAPKLTCDTKLDWLKKKDISAKLEDLIQYYGVRHPKAHMSTAEWDSVNEGGTASLKKLRQRCVGDVRAQLALYNKMVALGHLSGPKVWRP